MNTLRRLNVLGIAGQKGGVGKTTLATCLAVAAQEDGLKVAIFDIDDQGSASFWHDERRKTLHTESPAVISLHAVRLEAMLKAGRGRRNGLRDYRRSGPTPGHCQGHRRRV